MWSVTSYSELCREAQAVERWNRLHPGDAPRQSFLESSLGELAGPFIAASDNVRLVAEQIRQWIPGRYVTLGTDGFGRSDSREALRKHFEMNAENIVFATLSALAAEGGFERSRLAEAMNALGIDPEQVNPAIA